MTVRGYKDRQQEGLLTYSPTASRWAQRLLVGICAMRGWVLHSADISQAFLRGVTFEELSKLEPSQPHRRVAMEVPPGSVPLLRELPGMRDFDASKEVLELLRPGFGLKDAPRLFMLALGRALAKLKLVPLQCDVQLFARHVDDELVLLVSTHVDDLKYGGTDPYKSEMERALAQTFDELKIESKSFLHLGLQHTQLDDFSVRMDQIAYIGQLRKVSFPSAVSLDDPLSEEHHAAFRSLLGGVAWVTQT